MNASSVVACFSSVIALAEPASNAAELFVASIPSANALVLHIADYIPPIFENIYPVPPIANPIPNIVEPVPFVVHPDDHVEAITPFAVAPNDLEDGAIGPELNDVQPPVVHAVGIPQPDAELDLELARLNKTLQIHKF